MSLPKPVYCPVSSPIGLTHHQGDRESTTMPTVGLFGLFGLFIDGAYSLPWSAEINNNLDLAKGHQGAEPEIFAKSRGYEQKAAVPI